MGDIFLSLKSFYERTLTVDDNDGNPVQLPICIRRFSVQQQQQFSADRKRLEQTPESKLIVRKPDGEEQVKDTLTMGAISYPVPRIDDAEIRRRRLEEMTPEQREDFETSQAAAEEALAAFRLELIRDHVWLPTNVTLEFTDAAGETRVMGTGPGTGGDLLEVFGGNTETLRALSQAVFEENTLSADAKKNSRSLFGLVRSLSAKNPRADGDAPAAAAAPAVNGGSAASADVMDDHASMPSGSSVN